jgi:hypothetical protein
MNKSITEIFDETSDEITRLARQALGHGLTREEVAGELEAIAYAIRCPAAFGEDMSPIYTPRPRATRVGLRTDGEWSS